MLSCEAIGTGGPSDESNDSSSRCKSCQIPEALSYGWLLRVLVIFGAAACTAVGSLLDDREYVEDMYSSLEGSSWTDNTNWTTNADLGQWHGIVLNQDESCIFSIDLEFNNLQGSIPDIRPGQLSCLQAFNLRRNSISGSLPSGLENLTNLTMLELGDNELEGEIPPEIASISSLRILELEDNILSGSIPPELGDIVNLKNLYLHDNALEGLIPTDLGNLPSLTQLDLSGNVLLGRIPSSFGNLTALKALSLQTNSLTGDIPAELGTLAEGGALDQVDLSDNFLTGDVPSGLELVDLDVTGNLMSCCSPREDGATAPPYPTPAPLTPAPTASTPTPVQPTSAPVFPVAPILPTPPPTIVPQGFQSNAFTTVPPTLPTGTQNGSGGGTSTHGEKIAAGVFAAVVVIFLAFYLHRRHRMKKRGGGTGDSPDAEDVSISESGGSYSGGATSFFAKRSVSPVTEIPAANQAPPGFQDYGVQSAPTMNNPVNPAIDGENDERDHSHETFPTSCSSSPSCFTWSLPPCENATPSVNLASIPSCSSIGSDSAGTRQPNVLLGPPVTARARERSSASSSDTMLDLDGTGSGSGAASPATPAAPAVLAVASAIEGPEGGEGQDSLTRAFSGNRSNSITVCESGETPRVGEEQRAGYRVEGTFSSWDSRTDSKTDGTDPAFPRELDSASDQQDRLGATSFPGDLTGVDVDVQRGFDAAKGRGPGEGGRGGRTLDSILDGAKNVLSAAKHVTFVPFLPEAVTALEILLQLIEDGRGNNATFKDSYLLCALLSEVLTKSKIILEHSANSTAGRAMLENMQKEMRSMVEVMEDYKRKGKLSRFVLATNFNRKIEEANKTIDRLLQHLTVYVVTNSARESQGRHQEMQDALENILNRLPSEAP